MKIEELLKPKYEVHIVCNEKEKYMNVSGSTPSILTALSSFINALNESKIPKELIEYAVKQGFMSDKELRESTKENLEKLLNKLF